MNSLSWSLLCSNKYYEFVACYCTISSSRNIKMRRDKHTKSKKKNIFLTSYPLICLLEKNSNYFGNFNYHVMKCFLIQGIWNFVWFLAGRNNKNGEYDVGLSLTRCVFLMFKHVNWREKAVSPALPAGGGGDGPKFEPNIFEPVGTQWFSTL